MVQNFAFVTSSEFLEVIYPLEMVRKSFKKIIKIYRNGFQYFLYHIEGVDPVEKSNLLSGL